jgi:hypothetical protein
MPEEPMPAERREESEIDRVWNDLVMGRPGAPGDFLDPSAVEVMRAFQAMATTPPPATSRGHVDQTVLAAIERMASERRQEATVDQLGSLALPHSSFGRNGAAESVLHRTIEARRRAGWSGMAAQVATAALVLLTLVASIAVFASRGRDQEERHLVAPVASPTATAADGSQLLFTTLLDRDTLAEQIEVDIARGRISPGGSAEVATDDHWTEFPGVAVEYVLAGQLTLRSQAPMQLTRAAADRAEEIPADSEVVLGPGDVAAIAFDQPRIYTNSGDEPVELLLAKVAAAGWNPPVALSGIQDMTGIESGSFPSAELPTGPLALSLRQVTLGAGTPIPSEKNTRGPDGLVLSTGLLEAPGMGTPGTPEAQLRRVYILMLGSGAAAPA